MGEVAIKLADLGRISVSGSMHTRGFGQIDQKIDKRFKDNMYQYAASGNFELGKLLPVKAGIRLPFYAGISQIFSTPEFEPYQLDIPPLKQVDQLKTLYGADSARNYKKQIQSMTTRWGYNFSGVRFMPKLKAKTPQIWDPANLSGMLRGQFRGITEAKMIECLNHLGRDVQIVVTKAPRTHPRGHTRVVFA